MSKTKDSPAMEGGVDRSVDFRLKKEDLMLLILEGRKENMEEEIAKLQTVSTTLKTELREAEDKFRTKMIKLVLKSLNSETKRLAQGFGKKEEGAEEVDLEKVLTIELTSENDGIEYTKFSSKAIGDGKGSTYIKNQETSLITFKVYKGVKISIDISLHGKTFASPNEIFKRKDYVRACGEYARAFVLLEDTLDTEHQETLKEYELMEKTAEAIGKNESLLSDILAEYDLFSRNQPRAKAKMIKEVLSRDDQGSALLANIVQAAKGQKLLA